MHRYSVYLLYWYKSTNTDTARKQVVVLMNQFVDPDLAALKKEVEEAEGKLRSAEKVLNLLA